MMKRFLTAFTAVLLCVCCGACALSDPNNSAVSPVGGAYSVPAETDGPADTRDYIACDEYDEELVRAQIAAAEPSDDHQNIAGAVVPHYAPAMYMAADILSSVCSALETVVIVAPNHAGHGAALQICGSSYYWSSGTLLGDPEFAEELAAAAGVETDDSAAREDWSASLLVPYLGHYFPETRVVTVLLSRGAGQTQVQTLAAALADAARQRSLLVLGSADFSHYQDEQTARACDEETARVIENGDVSLLLTLGNEYLDSPETLAVLLRYAALTQREISRTDGLFESFIENGRRTAGSYYAYVVK